jgi:iron complex outermembrane receptor protein
MKVKQSPIAAAVTMTLLSITMAAQAQQAAPAAAQDTAQLEAVVITGIRASLQTAANIKKNANAVVDAVSAEDIGKLPDTDVGQSLGRIPGVAVGRAFGQGASVSIRGTDPQLTYTTLNGQSVASTGWYDQQAVDRSFNYSLLPSEMIGGMEVYKSSQADLTEGGIGGTVIVRTRKPLDLAANTAFVSGRLGKGTVSTDLNKEVAGLYSWKDEQKKFGVLIAAGIDDGEYIRRGVEADVGWSGDVAPSTFVQDRKRTAINVALQARPVQGVDLGLNYMSLELTGDNTNSSHYIFMGGAGKTCEQTNAAGVCVKNTATAASANDSFMQAWARKGKMTSDTLVLNGSYQAEGFKLEAVAGSTEAKGGTDQTINYGVGQWNAGQTMPKWTGTIDATGNQLILSPSSSQNMTAANLPTDIAPTGWATSVRGPNKDKEDFAQADLTMDLGWGAITSFKTGARFSKHEFNTSQERAEFKADFDTNPITGKATDLFNGTIQMGPVGWDFPKPNLSAMVETTGKNIARWVEQRAGLGQLKEDNTAAYGMFEFEQDKVRGNFGLRYIRTKATSTGYLFDGSALPAGDNANNTGWSTKKKTESTTYDDWLPSLNVAYTVQKNMVARFAASQAITRPNFDNMFLTKMNGYNDDRPNNQSLTYGTSSLKPMKSTQFDLGLEYYYGKGNLISATYFHKDIDNFVTADVKTNQKIGVVDPQAGVDNWTINTFKNAGGGKIDGIETQINHNFENGFGVVANYTFSDARAPASSYIDNRPMFTLSSKHTANLIGYWENDMFSSRLAYNYRSEYMIRETGYYGNRMHEGFGTLDLGLGWNATKNIKVTFDVANLLEADDVQFGGAPKGNTAVKLPLREGFPAWSYMGERTYRLGVSARF